MFSARVIAVCLLALYGVPAAIGPHWHHHGHSFAHNCCKDECRSVEGCHDSSAAHDDCCCAIVSKYPANEVNDGSAAEIAWQADLHECAVCAFYSLAQNPKTFYCGPARSELVSACIETPYAGRVCTHPVPHARGPPRCA